jgi:hypothetical protein
MTFSRCSTHDIFIDQRQRRPGACELEAGPGAEVLQP